ncbi:MAG: VWA domain-containing protein [Roseofilum sp. SBFL]|uniref:vWA domain-containing protein n=1 Tax=unclassified Roseofilum TaxID=2620099 RepID=UPI001B05BA7A|nr:MULTISPECIES: VWA domain-containing protein [unclassified Roseofilum]MBP0014336.1 VWA domain-containing protein [Roseofilum sp. SID3]MBP0024580.1 VWA domain-containing protein [Roseofilum sp. SID2]MBP0037901.1 VWA domain-containing protein [Roseofilum sp. SID1]MBP0040735.1 VWA domain-containing protein [Roseofilum sp. SBFL]
MIELEFADNPEPRCPVVLLLDTSSSMSGAPITQLNAGVATFQQEVQRDPTASLRVEVAIIAFSSDAQLVQDFVTLDQFNPPQLQANGLTAMGQAIELALDQVERRKTEYKNNSIQYYQPWIFLITDGEPNDSWQNAAQRVRQADADRKVSFFAIGVQGANINTLRQIAPANTPPLMLDGLKFTDLFRWLSDSMKRVSSSKVGSGQLSLPPVSGWAQVNT